VTPPDADQAMHGSLGNFDLPALRREFASQGAFVFIRDFLNAEITARLIAAVAAVKPSVNRNYLPGHKQGGSVSRHTIDAKAPFISELYRSPAKDYRCRPRRIRTAARCISIRGPATTSAGITTRRITAAAVTRC